MQVGVRPTDEIVETYNEISRHNTLELRVCILFPSPLGMGIKSGQVVCYQLHGAAIDRIGLYEHYTVTHDER